jgi:hypothetical protein
MPCEGLHSFGERERGPIPLPATITKLLQVGVMATREKNIFPNSCCYLIFILVSKLRWGPLGHSTET